MRGRIIKIIVFFIIVLTFLLWVNSNKVDSYSREGLKGEQLVSTNQSYNAQQRISDV